MLQEVSWSPGSQCEEIERMGSKIPGFLEEPAEPPKAVEKEPSAPVPPVLEMPKVPEVVAQLEGC